jgi:predicted nucleic acid-binding protein
VTRYSPRVLDTSALILMFSGHSTLMRMLDDAEAGRIRMLVPTVAIAEAEHMLLAGMRMWEHFLAFRGLRAMDLSEHTAIEAGRIAGQLPDDFTAGVSALMIGQVVYEAQVMGAAVVTNEPTMYRDIEVAVLPL